MDMKDIHKRISERISLDKVSILVSNGNYTPRIFPCVRCDTESKRFQKNKERQIIDLLGNAPIVRVYRYANYKCPECYNTKGNPGRIFAHPLDGRAPSKSFYSWKVIDEALEHYGSGSVSLEKAVSMMERDTGIMVPPTTLHDWDVRYCGNGND